MSQFAENLRGWCYLLIALHLYCLLCLEGLLFFSFVSPDISSENENLILFERIQLKKVVIIFFLIQGSSLRQARDAPEVSYINIYIYIYIYICIYIYINSCGVFLKDGMKDGRFPST